MTTVSTTCPHCKWVEVMDCEIHHRMFPAANGTDYYRIEGDKRVDLKSSAELKCDSCGGAFLYRFRRITIAETAKLPEWG